MSTPGTYGNNLRLCGTCSGSFLAYGERAWPVTYICPKCTKRRMDGFDPQPGDRVYHVDRQEGPFSELLVRARRGDLVQAWPVGWQPEEVVAKLGMCVTYSVGELAPPGAAAYEAGIDGKAPVGGWRTSGEWWEPNDD